MANRVKKKPVDSLSGSANDPQVDETESPDPKDNDETLAWLIRQFNDSADASNDSRKEAQIYRDYYDGKQWSDEEIAKLNERGQPAITDNLIKDKVDYTLGLERKLRTDPKALARHPQDDPGADAVTAALKYVADCNHFPQAVKSPVFGNMAVEGFGGCEVIADNSTYARTSNKKILLRYIRWDRLYYDPHSMLSDFSDARYMGIVMWKDLDEAVAAYKANKKGQPGPWKYGKADYPEFAEYSELFSSESFVAGFPTYDDVPRWFDRGRKRVQILEHYYRRGDEWYRAVFSRVGFIEPPAKSVYIDAETGATSCPIILQSLYVDRKGNRYGQVKRYKDLQDEVNKRRSKSLHLLSVNQATAEKGAVDDVDKARKELARPDGFVEYTPGMKLEVRDNADLAEGQFRLLQEARMAMSTTGPNEALLGQQGNTSGRKTQLDQQGGLISLGIQGDAIRFWQKRVMTAVFSRMKQFMTGEQFIRITDGEKSKFMAVNSAYPADHAAVKAGTAQPNAPMNVIPEMEMDIIIDEAPEVATVQQEDFQALVSLAGDARIPIPPTALIEASSLSSATKKKVLDSMQGHLPDGTEIPPQVQQQIEQAQAQIQQISQAQRQKAQEQQQTEQELSAQKMQVQAQTQTLQAKQQAMDALFGAHTAELNAQQSEMKATLMTIQAKEVELKALQTVIGANLQAAQDATNAVVNDSSQQLAVNEMANELSARTSEHREAMANLGVKHAHQIKQLKDQQSNKGDSQE